MAEITLVKQTSGEIPEADRDAARRVLFGVVDGLGEQHRRAWRRMWNWFLRAEPGEMLEIRTHRDRLGWYHRKHMAMEQRIFEAQERFQSFDAFRAWLKVGSGYVEWYPGPRGGVIPVPKSMSYATLEQDDMEKLHSDMLDFLRTEHACRTLWPSLPAAQRTEAIEEVLSQFGRFAE